ncbi:MAG: hypothetical protein H6P98_558 [Candidatus Aminicenantes bacterium]|nr:hypothetical protein [Candidatus Aminicenantes bacterium]
MASQNHETVWGYFLCLNECFDILEKDPTSRQSVLRAIACWNGLLDLLAIPGLCKAGQLPPRG